MYSKHKWSNLRKVANKGFNSLVKTLRAHAKPLGIDVNLYMPGADPGRGERGSSHGQIFSTFFFPPALTFLKILC